MRRATPLLLLVAPSAVHAATLTVDSSAGPYYTIQDAIDAASSGDTISVSAARYRENIQIDGKDLTIAGQGSGLSTIRPDDYTIVDIENATVTFTGFTLDGRGNDGQGFFIYDADVTIDDVIVTDTQNDGNTVTGNTWGIAYGGGAEIWNSTVAITDSSFDTTWANDEGGGVFAGYTSYLSGSATSVTLDGVTFTDATTDGSGGGLYAYFATVTVSGSSFDSCTADNEGGGAFAHGSTVSFSSTDFTSDRATYGGGAAYLEQESGKNAATFSGGTLSSNTATNGNGGAIYTTGSSATLSLTGVAFDANSTGSSYSGGALYASSATVTSSGSTFSSNSGRYGGAVYLTNGSSTTTASFTGTGDLFASNQASSSYDGGAVYVAAGSGKSTLSESAGSFTGNSAGRGGAVFSASTGDVSLTDGDFSSNRAATQGGAVSLNQTSSSSTKYTLTGDTFSSNAVTGTTSTYAGGAVYVGYGTVTLKDGDLSSNSAPAGGAVYLSSTQNLTLVGNQLCANTATASHGGGAYLSNVGSGGTLSLTNDVFVENSASASSSTLGGGLYYTGTTTPKVVNDDFLGNKAGDGGAAYFSGVGYTFENNVVSSQSAGNGVAADATSSGKPYSLVYNDWYANTSANLGGSIASVTLDATNLTATDPQLQVWSADGDCSNDDFQPKYGAPVVNAGDPSITDPDGSRSDIGAFGGSAASSALYTDADGDGYLAVYECDDTNASVHPGATETCNGLDDDCDGTVDNSGASGSTTYYADADGDGYGDPTVSVLACSAPSGYVATGTDCDDTNAAKNPGHPEYCDGVDNDCDGTTDEPAAVDATTWYADADGDGYGNPSTAVTSCSAPGGYVATGGDCDDKAAAVNPAATEVCDGVDNDCDGTVDIGVSTGTTYYRDADGDGYGDAASAVVACGLPSGYASNAVDCDDTSGAINPSASEICDGKDDDCDGAVDENDAIDAPTWYADADGDGWGDTTKALRSCAQPVGYSGESGDCDDADTAYHPFATETCSDTVDYNCDGSTGTADADHDGTIACQDCDDADASIHPGATETCDGLDDDCDGVVDEADAADATIWYADADGDGYGDATESAVACAAPAGFVADGRDCDDTSALYHPYATETCADALDYNCDGSVGNVDNDGDGVVACLECDDADAAVHPGAADVCDGKDDDCDGLVDEDGATWGDDWYADADGDGHGNPDATEKACDQPDGYVDVGDDCDDADAAISPDADEVWYDGVDEACDGGDDMDQDADGSDDALHGGDDCVDTDPAIHPGATDVPDDGVDQDCSGEDATSDGGLDTGINGGNGRKCGCDAAGSGGASMGAVAGLLGLVLTRRRRP